MSNIVFILGAGASAQAGAPLMNSFIDRARVICTSQYNRESESLRKVFQAIHYLQSVHSKINTFNPYNIESVFSLLDMAKFLDYPVTEGGDTDLTKELITLIQNTLELSIIYQPMNNGFHATPYERFAKLLRALTKQGHRITIITFNYDIALEISLHQESIAFNYFEENKNPPGHASVTLLKLHGSLSWYIDAENKLTSVDFKKFTSDKYFTLSLVHQLPEQHKYIGVKIPGSKPPLIVPPSWYKGEYQLMIKPVWSRAVTALEQVNHLYVIGYSFPKTDSYFDMLLSLGLVKSDPISAFKVFDINKALEERYREVLGPSLLHKFKSIDENTFEEAIVEIEKEFGIYLTDAEKIKRAHTKGLLNIQSA